MINNFFKLGSGIFMTLDSGILLDFEEVLSPLIKPISFVHLFMSIFSLLCFLNVNILTENMLLYYSKSTTFDYILLASLDELSDLNTKLGNKKSKMDKITVDLALREEEIQKLEQKLDQKLIIFNNRIRCIYKNNDKNILEVFFKSIDFIEFLSRLKMMRLFAKQDAQAISEIK
jgi:hypothetical protein